ncbi:MAG: Ni/Fe hydrogenase subunit alpha [Desulfurobacteriaceae bacterium]
MRKVLIDPITRLEGHGRIELLFGENGKLEDVKLKVVELMGYEKFLVGMPAEEVPRSVSTICGVCRTVHFMASLKAIDQAFGTTPPKKAELLRKVVLLANHIEDHTEVLFALGLPDFIVGLDAPKGEKNLFGVAKKVGREFIKKVVNLRTSAAKIVEIVGAKSVHPTTAIPGGWSKKLKEEELKEIKKLAKDCLELGKLAVETVKEFLVYHKENSKFLKNEKFDIKSNFLATLDENGKVTYYDGIQVVKDFNGKELVRFKGKEYQEVIEEKVLPWSYSKFPYLKKLGWNGIVEGEGSSICSVGPLARFNVSDGYSTPMAQKEAEEVLEFFGKKPVLNFFAYHWLRAIEILNQAELLIGILNSPEILGGEIVNPATRLEGEGVGILEAPRGTLIHHYVTNEKGLIKDANLIVPTTINNSAIQLAVKKFAFYLLEKEEKITDEKLSILEVAHRPYDLCLACSTH